MDNEIQEELAPKKRVSRRATSTATKKTKIKSEEIPTSFTTAAEDLPEKYVYSDSVREIAQEDWSPSDKKPEPSNSQNTESSSSKPESSANTEPVRKRRRSPQNARKFDNRNHNEDRPSQDPSSIGEASTTTEGRISSGTESMPEKFSENPRDNARPQAQRNESNMGQNQSNDSRQNSGSRNDGRNFDKNSRQNNRNRQQMGRKRPTNTIRIGAFSIGYLRRLEIFDSLNKLSTFADALINYDLPPFQLNEILNKSNDDLADMASSSEMEETSSRGQIIDNCIESASAEKRPVAVQGILESMEGGDGILTYACDNYKIRAKSTFVPRCLIQSLGLRRGQTLTAYIHPSAESSSCPFALKIVDVFGRAPEEAAKFPRFKDLIPYYPTQRIFLEQTGVSSNDNISMRVIDLLSPIGLGQRGLIVAPPRTGKTVLLQAIANSIIANQPKAKLIVLLIDERPEEVTDFSRQVKAAEVISSTFDESSESHVHAAEIVIENARRQVEVGEHVVILLDSITRLARAYNAEQPSSGKVLSGGVEANALQLPKRFFGSARNIEGGGSLTIIATALIETGSRMDDVIFEEFKGTGNMELHLDRTLSDKRIFPAINLEKSGTRKEELLYHPDELVKIYNLRHVFQGVPQTEAMEMLLTRLKKTATNVEFLMNINR